MLFIWPTYPPAFSCLCWHRTHEHNVAFFVKGEFFPFPSKSNLDNYVGKLLLLNDESCWLCSFLQVSLECLRASQDKLQFFPFPKYVLVCDKKMFGQVMKGRMRSQAKGTVIPSLCQHLCLPCQSGLSMLNSGGSCTSNVQCTVLVHFECAVLV